MTKDSSAAERPLLSVTMIVKNEEEHLGRCLASVRGIADEIVVVDTGSTDRTVEIARSFGATVGHFAWCDDFAAARNEALRLATGQWCLHLDADEVLAEAKSGALRAELARQPEGRYFMRVTVRNRISGGLGDQIYGANRLYRNRPNVRWVRAIHENVVVEGEYTDETEGSCASTEVIHDGYADQTPEQVQRRHQRNLRLLRRMVRESPDDVMQYYYFSVEYMVAGRPAAALRWARTGIEKGKGRVRPDFLGALYCQSMRCALNLGKPKLAVKIGLEGASAYAFTELSYLLGASYVVLRDWANAEKYYELAMILRQRFSEYQMEVGTGSWKALIGLSVVAWERGDRDLAFDRAKRAYEWAPDQGLPNMVYGQVLMARQRWAEAELYLRRAIEIAPALSEAHLRLSQTLVALNRHQEAYDHLNDLWRARPEVPAHAIWLGELLYEVEEYQECVNVLGAAIEQHTDQPAIYQRLAEALVKIGRHEDALNAYSLASALDPKNEQAQMGLSLATYLARWDTLRSSAVRTLSVA